MSNEINTIFLVSVGRSDVGIWAPVLRALTPHFECGWGLSGTHLLEGPQSTRSSIEGTGIPVRVAAPGTPDTDSPLGMARAHGQAVSHFADGFAAASPDLVFVLGDRFETHAAAVAAALLNIPLAHLHGGELSLGAIDDSLRHSITKLSHLHFVSADPYARRVAQLGEEPWRIIVSGAPALDDILSLPHLPTTELETLTGISLTQRPFLITLHPESLNPEETAPQADALLAALESFSQPLIFTAPNADAGGRAIRRAIESFVSRRQNAVMVENLGSRAYYSMMKESALMIGNSSSGIIEAASFRLPVVNLGTRQAGRLRTPNIIDCPFAPEAISSSIHKALDPEFRRSLQTLQSPYGNGSAGTIILNTLQNLNRHPPLIPKQFIDH